MSALTGPAQQPSYDVIPKRWRRPQLQGVPYTGIELKTEWKPSRGSAVSHTPIPTLAHGLAFADLYTREGLAMLDRCFVEALHEADPPLAARLAAARNAC